MNVRIVAVDPKQSGAAAVIYEYGEEKFSEGLWAGAMYAALALTFLFCVREFLRARRA